MPPSQPVPPEEQVGGLQSALAEMAVETWLRFLVWLAIGMAVYLFYGRRHARLAGPDPAEPGEERARPSA